MLGLLQTLSRLVRPLAHLEARQPCVQRLDQPQQEGAEGRVLLRRVPGPVDVAVVSDKEKLGIAFDLPETFMAARVLDGEPQHLADAAQLFQGLRIVPALRRANHVGEILPEYLRIGEIPIAR